MIYGAIRRTVDGVKHSHWLSLSRRLASTAKEPLRKFCSAIMEFCIGALLCVLLLIMALIVMFKADGQL